MSTSQLPPSTIPSTTVIEPLTSHIISKSLALLDLCEELTHKIVQIRTKLLSNDPNDLNNPQLELIHQKLTVTLIALQQQLNSCQLATVPINTTLPPVFLAPNRENGGVYVTEKLNEAITEGRDGKGREVLPTLDFFDKSDQNNNQNNPTPSPTRLAHQLLSKSPYNSPQELINAVPAVDKKYTNLVYFQPATVQEAKYLLSCTKIALSLPPQELHIPLTTQTTFGFNTIHSAVEFADRSHDVENGNNFEGSFEENWRQNSPRYSEQNLTQHLAPKNKKEVTVSKVVNDQGSTNMVVNIPALSGVLPHLQPPIRDIKLALEFDQKNQQNGNNIGKNIQNIQNIHFSDEKNKFNKFSPSNLGRSSITGSGMASGSQSSQGVSYDQSGRNISAGKGSHFQNNNFGRNFGGNSNFNNFSNTQPEDYPSCTIKAIQDRIEIIRKEGADTEIYNDKTGLIEVANVFQE
jgi:hypothetical protein